LLRRLKFIAVIAAIGGWFFGNAWRGLTEFFSGDDMMNLYHAWDFPLRHLIVANLTPFNKVYRPAGAVFYRVLYDLSARCRSGSRSMAFCWRISRWSIAWRSCCRARLRSAYWRP
jgi:hypothetical protein